MTTNIIFKLKRIMKTILSDSTIISLDISLVSKPTKTIIFIKENTKRILISQYSFLFQ